ncbi:alpha-protein kinase 1-like isoform X1 [Bombus pyrosoma]|uniref:alpha-protein kinase 1-like isoform X1 n=1 Tax=Bombus pyrosoma TaxID=396416 RepID=UPI001CB8DEB5|nr:alpha-protein kinase 1-like isoform X1 [Bombus pyrosoma]
MKRQWTARSVIRGAYRITRSQRPVSCLVDRRRSSIVPWIPPVDRVSSRSSSGIRFSTVLAALGTCGTSGPPIARDPDPRTALILFGFEPLWPIALIRSLPCPWEGQQQRQQQQQQRQQQHRHRHQHQQQRWQRQQRPTCTHNDCKKTNRRGEKLRRTAERERGEEDERKR